MFSICMNCKVMLQALLICIVLLRYTFGYVFPINSTVAQDGSGDFYTICDAINAVPDNNKERFYIKVKAGTYWEHIVIEKAKQRVTLVGERMENTTIVGNRSNRTGYSTSHSATADIKGHQFVAVNITFQNVAGPGDGQAVALKSSVESAFYKCRFFGFQDTLYASEGKQFYRDCEINGTVDFIWGNAIVVLQKCLIIVGKPLHNQYNTITAQGRSYANGAEGTILHNCNISASSDLEKQKSAFKTYLGRPWRPYARVVVMQSFIDNLVEPRGWVKWDKNTQVGNLYYGEYKNEGPGNKTDKRVKWPGVLTSKEAEHFSVRNFINGSKWIPFFVPFDSDLY